MKRFIFFVGTLQNGGAERVISLLASRMAEQGISVEILTYYDRPVFYEINPKVKVTAVEKCTGKSNKLINLLWIRKYFNQNAKVVISFLAPFNMMAIAAKIGTGIPIIVADRNDPSKVPANIIVRKARNFLYMFANAIVLQTEKNRSYFNRLVRKKSKVIYNPVNLGEYTGSALHSKKEKQIVTAGRLMPQKNQKMLIQAFSSIVKSYPEYQLIIYGEGPIRNELEMLIQQLEIQNHVLMPGSVINLHERMKSAELFVLSSDYEGMPNALIEAMCLGLPVISTKVSGATDLIEDGKSGILIEAGAEKELADAMMKLISEEKIRNDMAAEAVKLSDHLLLNEILKQWMDVIDNEIYKGR